MTEVVPRADAGQPDALTLTLAALHEYEARLCEGFSLGGAARWRRAATLVSVVPADAFLRPPARVCVASPARRRQLLALRALFARRSAVRRCIDRAGLSAMGVAVGGSSVLTLLRGAAAEDGETVLALPPALEADALARDGLARLLAGEPAAAALATLAGYPGNERHPERLALDHTQAENTRFFFRLSQWMPEWT